MWVKIWILEALYKEIRTHINHLYFKKQMVKNSKAKFQNLKNHNEKFLFHNKKNNDVNIRFGQPGNGV